MRSEYWLIILVIGLLFVAVVANVVFVNSKESFECHNCTTQQVEKAMQHNQEREAIHQQHTNEAISYLNKLYGDKK